MNTKNKIIIITVGIVIVLAVIFGFKISTRGVPVGEAGSSYPYYGLGTSSSVLCTNAIQTKIVSTSTSLQYLQLQNTTPNSQVWVGLGAPAATGTGLLLTSTTSAQTLNAPIYAGSIYCLAQGSNATVTVEQLQ